MSEPSAPSASLPSSGDPELWGHAKGLVGDAVAALLKACEVYAGNGLAVPPKIIAAKNAAEEALRW